MKTISRQLAERVAEEEIWNTQNYQYRLINDRVYRLPRWKVGTYREVKFSEWEECRTPDDD